MRNVDYQPWIRRKKQRRDRYRVEEEAGRWWVVDVQAQRRIAAKSRMHAEELVALGARILAWL